MAELTKYFIAYCCDTTSDPIYSCRIGGLSKEEFECYRKKKEEIERYKHTLAKKKSDHSDSVLYYKDQLDSKEKIEKHNKALERFCNYVVNPRYTYHPWHLRKLLRYVYIAKEMGVGSPAPAFIKTYEALFAPKEYFLSYCMWQRVENASDVGDAMLCERVIYCVSLGVLTDDEAVFIAQEHKIEHLTPDKGWMKEWKRYRSKKKRENTGFFAIQPLQHILSMPREQLIAYAEAMDNFEEPQINTGKSNKIPVEIRHQMQKIIRIVNKTRESSPEYSIGGMLEKITKQLPTNGRTLIARIQDFEAEKKLLELGHISLPVSAAFSPEELHTVTATMVDSVPVSLSSASGMRHSIAHAPRMLQAATGVGVPGTVLDGAYQTNIEDSDDSLVNVRDKDANETLKRIEDLLQKPRPVYLEDAPKDAVLKPEDCPVEGKDGFWVSQKDYAKRVGLTTGTLTAYRKASEGARWSSDETWGMTKDGQHIFKKIEPNNQNSEYLYFVRYKK